MLVFEAPSGKNSLWGSENGGHREWPMWCQAIILIQGVVSRGSKRWFNPNQPRDLELRNSPGGVQVALHGYGMSKKSARTRAKSTFFIADSESLGKIRNCHRAILTS